MGFRCVLVFFVLFATGCDESSPGNRASLRFAWTVGSGAEPCPGEVTRITWRLTTLDDQEVATDTEDCAVTSAEIDDLELARYHLVIEATCDGTGIGYRFDSRLSDALSAESPGVNDAGTLSLSRVSSVCDPGGDVEEGFGCCADPDFTAEPCFLGLCAGGLQCDVVPQGPYANHGVCGSVESCDPSQCATPNNCQSGELCNAGLTCRPVMGYGFCIP